jgi:membrane-bound metal-dependent hydrolase YbcI (DUF457 family)
LQELRDLFPPDPKAMTGKQHLVIGTLAVAVCLYVVSADNGQFNEAVIPAAVGALWPDTDIRTSLLGRFIPLWMARGITHRGFTHSYWAAVVFALAWHALFPGAIWFFIAYFLHIACDRIGTFMKRGLWRRKQETSRKQY